MNGAIRFRNVVFFILILTVFGSMVVSADPGRWSAELSGNNWKLWLDKKAEWKNDTLFMPPVNLANVPVNPPTCGWDRLHNDVGDHVAVPGTVEQYHWQDNGNPVGEAGDYRGVSWW
ncbi:MAG: hypothetical protein JXB48_09475, partial [Candidatus Latescibacteria bacterium]|nr:hypothetical protein [Candidatus Latescibacterota bacterium]